MKKLDSTDLKPCPHMRLLVSAHIDSMLPGIADWYTRQHIKGCPQCQASMPFLASLKSRLGELDSNSTGATALSQERLDVVEARLKTLDSHEIAD